MSLIKYAPYIDAYFQLNLTTISFRQNWSFRAKLLSKGPTLPHTSLELLNSFLFIRSVRQSWSFWEQLGSKGPTLPKWYCIWPLGFYVESNYFDFVINWICDRIVSSLVIFLNLRKIFDCYYCRGVFWTLVHFLWQAYLNKSWF